MELFYWTALTMCSMTKFTFPGGAITRDDSRAAARALVHCGELYPNSPCVGELRRVSIRNYHVICSAIKKE